MEFNPIVDQSSPEESWVILGKGSPQLLAHHARAEQVVRGKEHYDINTLPLRNPDTFVSCGLHNHVNEWRKILSSDERDEVISYIRDGIDITSLFRPFKGNFKGKSYNRDGPPRQYFPNSSTCKQYASFVKSELLSRIQNGSMRVWGRVGECDMMPKVIMPLVVEPSKPRLCNDDSFLNLWTKDVPFRLETLKDAHRLIAKDATMVTCEEESGYDHV